jgi:hypothetical protein
MECEISETSRKIRLKIRGLGNQREVSKEFSKTSSSGRKKREKSETQKMSGVR